MKLNFKTYATSILLNSCFNSENKVKKNSVFICSVFPADGCCDRDQCSCYSFTELLRALQWELDGVSQEFLF